LENHSNMRLLFLYIWNNTYFRHSDNGESEKRTNNVANRPKRSFDEKFNVERQQETGHSGKIQNFGPKTRNFTEFSRSKRQITTKAGEKRENSARWINFIWICDLFEFFNNSFVEFTTNDFIDSRLLFWRINFVNVSFMFKI